jgi:DNA-binding transcriptional MerR regulator
MEFISRGDVLKLFDISIWTLRRWQKNNSFPSAISASGKVRMYRKSAVEAWLEAQADSSEPDNLN